MKNLAPAFRHGAVLFVMMLAFVSPALAAKDLVYTGWLSNAAVGGYDAVSYFTEGKPVKGSDDYAFEYNGATWLFASAGNRDAFAANPARYAPQYGGYCAWAVSQGYTAKGDPGQWKIVNDKLYLNYNADVKARWEQNIPGNIRSGDANWPKVLE